MMSQCVQTRLRLSITGAILTAVISCGGSDAGTGPDNSTTIASLGLTESAITVQVAFSHQLVAAPKNASGAAVPGIQITWTSDNPAVATINDGTVTALQTGTAKITASGGGQTATVAVSAIPTIVASLQLSRTKATLSPGRTAQITAIPLDSLDRAIPGRSVSFFTSDPSVASVSSTGLVTAVSPGIAQITVASDFKNRMVSVFVVSPTTVSIPLKTAQPAGLSSLSSYSLWLRDADDSLSAIGAIGTSSALTGSMALADTVQFVAQGDPGSAGASWSSSFTVALGALPASVPVVLIPHSFLLTSGSFAGTTAFVNMTAAIDPCLVKSDQCFSGFYAQYWRTGVKGWAAFPVPVYLQGITGADSAGIWTSLRGMESAFGRPIFIPDAGTTPNHITLSIGVPTALCGATAGCTTWQWDAYDRITGAQIALAQSAINQQAVVQHEFLHALGFLHTCSWPSVMGGYGCPQANQITVADVSYALLAMAVHASEAPLRLSNGALPCGAMGVWAAAPDQHISVSCDGDAFRVPADNRLLTTRVIGPTPPGGGSDWAK